MLRTYTHDNAILNEILNSSTIIEVNNEGLDLFMKCIASNHDETRFFIKLHNVSEILENAIYKNNFTIQYNEGEIINYKLSNCYLELVINWIDYNAHYSKVSVHEFKCDKVEVVC